MNKSVAWVPLFLLFLGCASNQKTSATAVVPKGNVIFFSKVNSNVVIKECESYAVVQKQKKCQPRAGTRVRTVPVDRLKSRLKNALFVQDFKPKDASEKSKVEEAIRTRDKAIIIEELSNEKKRIEGFIQFYCGSIQANNDCAKKNEAVAKLNEIMTRKSSDEKHQASTELNQLIDKLVDECIGSERVTSYKFSDASRSIAYQILRSYVRPSSVEINFVTVRSGSYIMGSPSIEKDRYIDEVQIPTKITKDFDMSTTVITQLQWWAVMGTNPSYFSKQQFCPVSYIERDGIGLCPNFPVEEVSWNEVQDFITKLNSQDSKYSYRLPTEAEWEYAARAGTLTAYSFGDDVSQLGEYAWYSDNSGKQTHDVATKKANPWGLHDVHGNVWEWMQDWYSGNRSTAPQTDPVGPSSGSFRLGRGGSLFAGPRGLRSAVRGFSVPSGRAVSLGARLVRSAK